MIALCIAVVLVLGAWVFSHGGTLSFKNIWGTRVQISREDAPTLGRADAPVTIVEYADFQCPSCAVFQLGAGAALMDEYVKTGKARFVFKQFPLLGDESFNAAYASLCAEAQGKFWQYHDALFEKQSQSGGENTGMFSMQNLILLAGNLGLNTDSFSACLNKQTYKDVVAQDIAEGQAAGVTGTPTVFINGHEIAGSSPVAVYQQVIDNISQ